MDKTMTFKEYKNWMNDRACDGMWGMIDAISFIETYNKIKKLPFWKRENEWKRISVEEKIIERINIINQKIEEWRINNGIN